MTGFRLARLIVAGDGKPEASVSFKAGLNVLTGPSNSGKSYIVECIDFVLGSDTIPGEDIDESKGYEWAFLEIETHAGETFTLQRGLAGGEIQVHESRYADKSTAVTRTLASESQTKKNETLSTFLLKQMDIGAAKIRTNASGELGNLTFRTISHLFIVDETSIIAKKRSPVRLATGYAKTASLNEPSTISLLARTITQ
jgi:predicted ATP-dependent endonuclease of OLD family